VSVFLFVFVNHAQEEGSWIREIKEEFEKNIEKGTVRWLEVMTWNKVQKIRRIFEKNTKAIIAGWSRIRFCVCVWSSEKE